MKPRDARLSNAPIVRTSIRAGLAAIVAACSAVSGGAATDSGVPTDGGAVADANVDRDDAIDAAPDAPSFEPGSFRCDGHTWQTKGAAGVWVDKGDCSPRKVCNLAPYSGSVGVVRHWGGSSWTSGSACLPVGLGLVGGAFAGTTGDMWIAGVRSKEDGNFGGAVVLRWDGTYWTEDGRFDDLQPTGIWRDAAGDVWIYGQRKDAGAIVRRTGGRWLDVSPSASTFGSSRSAIASLHSAPDGTLWAVGAAGGRAVALRWSESAWHSVPFVDGETGHAVWTFAANDAWATAKQYFGSGVAHWDGARWAAVSMSGSIGSRLLGFAPNDLWTLEGWHYDGTKWSDTHVPLFYVASIVRVGPSELWAFLGDHCYPSPNTTMATFDGAAWTLHAPLDPVFSTEDLGLAWGSSKIDIWFAQGFEPFC